MDFKKVLETLASEFAKKGVDFAVMGGLALHFAGVSRATVDIDLIVALKDSGSVDEVMRKFGYELLHKSEDAANYSSPLAPLGRVDFLFAHRKYALAIMGRASAQNLFGYAVKIARPEDIIGLKVQAMTNDAARYHKDMADIEEIMRANPDKLDMEIIREYFRLFDREKELDDIIKKLK